MVASANARQSREVIKAFRSSEQAAQRADNGIQEKLWALAQDKVIKRLFAEVGVEGLAGDATSRVELEIGATQHLLGLTREEAVAYLQSKAQTALMLKNEAE